MHHVMEIVGVSGQTFSFILQLFYTAGLSLQTSKSASLLSYFKRTVYIYDFKQTFTLGGFELSYTDAFGH